MLWEHQTDLRNNNSHFEAVTSQCVMEKLLNSSQWTDTMRNLVKAVIDNDVTKLQSAVPHGCDKDNLAGALCSAVLLRRHHCIDALINTFGADPLRPYANRSSVHWAVDRQDLVSLELLINKKSLSETINDGGELERSWYEQRRPVDEALFIACWLGRIEPVRFLLEHGADPNTCYFYNEEFLLHCSALIVAFLAPISQRAPSNASHNTEIIVETLVKAGANIDRRCSTGRTPLHWAVAANLDRAVSLLISSGANVGEQTAGSRQTPLMLAVSFDCINLVNTLLAAGCCIDDVDGADCTALCYAVDKRNHALAEHLLHRGASPDGAPFSNALATPLLMATSSGDREMMMLLVRWGANVNRQTKTRNAFATAINVNNFSNAHLLLKFGADSRLARQLVLDQQQQILSKAGGQPNLLRLPEKLRLRELKLLECKAARPRTLSGHCRLIIRRNISPPSCRNLQKLPLPEIIIRYLSFDELV